MTLRMGLSSFIRGLAARVRKDGPPAESLTSIINEAAKELHQERSARVRSIECRIRRGQPLRKDERRFLKRISAAEGRSRAGQIVTLPVSKRRYVVDRNGAWRRIVEPCEEHRAARGVVRRSGKWYVAASLTPMTTIP